MGRRSRKRTASSEASRAPRPSSAKAARARVAQNERRGRRDVPDRPPGLFGPVPVAELLIVIGAILLFVGIARGTSDGINAIAAGFGLCALGSLELALREHLTGFKSHTIFICVASAALTHIAAAVIGGSDLATNPGVVVLDVLAAGAGFWAARRYHGVRSPQRRGVVKGA